MPLLSTLSGAVIGIAATLIADRNSRIRDAYARGVPVGSGEDAPLIAQRRTAMARMRDRMREDLGVGPLGIE
ncbi:hypothetical protein HCC61_07675 [Streptomyces sp. HNM0575]|nr:hypothetical protein [Streptomyces sp. HNM0575]